MLEKKMAWISAAAGRQLALDISFPSATAPEAGWPLLIFAHGFKGFKDWGHWNALAEAFAQAGYAFLKFNFSHNGLGQNLIDFEDLAAFGQNNYSKECFDFEAVLDFIQKSDWPIQKTAPVLIGHSRGGPIAALTALKRGAKALISWASVHELDYAWQNEAILAHWKKEGRQFIRNGRTKQNMPLDYQLYEDFKAHEEAFRLGPKLVDLSCPYLIVHGNQDPAVSLTSAHYLDEHCPQAELLIIEGADHVFGGRHPFPEGAALPPHSQILFRACLDFLAKL